MCTIQLRLNSKIIITVNGMGMDMDLERLSVCVCSWVGRFREEFK